MNRKALIFQGGWPGHQPEVLASRFRQGLSDNGWDVTVSESLDVLDEAEPLLAYDLIIPTWTMGQLSGKQEENLCRAVDSGTGLAGVHGTMGDAFRGSINYEWMVGGRFVGHPYVGSYVVRVRQTDHPLTRDLPDRFIYDSEQYYMQIDPGVNVLLDTVYDLGGKSVIMPVAWTKHWGRGRVFYSALGHDPAEFDSHPKVWDFTMRGALWAAR